MIAEAFKIFLAQPLFNALIVIYLFLPNHDLGVAMILLTIGIKVLIFPINRKAYRLQAAMASLQPRLKMIQEKYKSNPAEQARLTTELFQAEKINPLASFGPLLIQLPILLALYQLFWKGVWDANTQLLYPFLPQPGQINPFFLNWLDLSQPSLGLAALAGVLQFAQSTVLMSLQPTPPAADERQAMVTKILQKEMLFLFPLLTFFILIKMPSALGLYWSVSSLLAVAEQFWFKKHAV